MKNRATIPLLFLLIAACGPSEEEKNQAALDVYTANESKIKAKREAMDEAYARVDKLGAEESAMPFDLKDKPPVDITTYPKNAWLVINEEGIDDWFITLERMRTGNFEIYRNDSLEDVSYKAGLVIKELERLRYLGVIKILELKEPSFTGKDQYKKSGITMGFVPGEAKARVFVFDLTDGECLGSIAIEARNSPKVKLRGIEFENSVKFELRQKIKEAAVTEVQFWDEVNRKK